mmetsp:Transcript_11478/g.20757  ORF Transcript_11478/g.20757 Transcript_11478/m.20757 type:complete len:87 (-) Transcript_11478:1153-1413(-)
MDTKVSDVSVLSGFLNLKHLGLVSTRTSKISSTLTNLTSLNLGYTSISHISALSELVKLKNLSLARTNVSSISAPFTSHYSRVSSA